MGLRITIVLSLLGVLVACSGTSSTQPGRGSSGASSTSAGGSIWDLLEEGRRRKAEHQSRVVSSGREADLPSHAKGVVQAWFDAYRKKDPVYQIHRDEIEGFGPVGSQIMVDNLIRYGVAALHSGSGPEVTRTQQELTRYFDHAAFTLVEGLAAGHGDSVARAHAGELLGGLGERALPIIAEGFERAGSGTSALLDTDPRRDLARAARLVGSPAATPLLSSMAGSGESVAVRLEALTGLGQTKVVEALPAYITGLEDDDRSVRKFAARYCREPGVADPELLRVLVDCLDRAYRAGERDVAIECEASLERLVARGQRTPEQWRVLVRGRT